MFHLFSVQPELLHQHLLRKSLFPILHLPVKTVCMQGALRETVCHRWLLMVGPLLQTKDQLQQGDRQADCFVKMAVVLEIPTGLEESTLHAFGW